MSSISNKNDHNNNSHGSRPDMNEPVTNSLSLTRWGNEIKQWISPDYKQLELKIVDHAFAAQVASAIIHTETYGPMEVNIHLTNTYPKAPPRIFIVHHKVKGKRIEHPYIHRSTGEICPAILENNWCIAMTIAKLMITLPIDVIDRYITESTMACFLASNIHNQDCVFVVEELNQTRYISAPTNSSHDHVSQVGKDDKKNNNKKKGSPKHNNVKRK